MCLFSCGLAASYLESQAKSCDESQAELFHSVSEMQLSVELGQSYSRENFFEEQLQAVCAS